MDTLDRFLIREFLSYFTIILLILTALYLGVDFLSRFWGLDKPLVHVLELYVYKTPAVVQQFVPVACLMAVLFVLTLMSRQNEVLALFAGGIGPFRLVSTFVAIVAVLSTCSFLSFDSLIPTFSKKQILLERGQSANGSASISYTPTGFWYRSGRLLYNVGRFHQENNTLEDINVFVLDSRFRLSQRLHSNTASFRDDQWVLEDGHSVNYPSDDPFPRAERFSSLTGIIPEKPSEFKNLVVEEKTMRLRDLRKYIERNSSYGLDTTAQQVSYHERLALIFTPLIFVLLAIPFALQPLKNYTLGKSVAFCMSIVFVFLIMFRFTLSIGKGGHIPPVVAGWSPNLLFLCLAIYRIWRRV